MILASYHLNQRVLYFPISWREEDEILYKALGKALYEYETNLQNMSVKKMDGDKYNLHPVYNYQIKYHHQVF